MAFSQRQAGAKVAAASKTCYLESKSGDGPNIAVAPRCEDAKNGKGRNYNSNHNNNNNNNTNNKYKFFSKMRSSPTIPKASSEPFISASGPKGPPQNTSNLSPLTDGPELLQDKFQLQNLSFLHLSCLSENRRCGYFEAFLELQLG